MAENRKARIFEILIEDADEKYAPPEEPLLRLSIVGSRLFVQIVKRVGSDREPTYKPVAGMAVSAGAFREAFSALVNAERYEIEH